MWLGIGLGFGFGIWLGFGSSEISSSRTSPGARVAVGVGMAKLVLGGGLRVIAWYVAGMSEALVRVRVLTTCCSTVALPQSMVLVVRVTLGPTASACSSTAKAGSAVPQMRTSIGSDMGPRRWQVKWHESSMDPLPLISPVWGVASKKPMV